LKNSLSAAEGINENIITDQNLENAKTIINAMHNAIEYCPKKTIRYAILQGETLIKARK
jgi:hypothetical protein